jgi:hypothetical protein
VSINLKEAEFAERFEGGEGLLPAQWGSLNGSEIERAPEQNFFAAILVRAIEDWSDLHGRGYLQFDPKRALSLEDGLELGNWLFDDSYGAGDDSFVSLRVICKSLALELATIRSQLKKIGTPEDLFRILKPRGIDREAA